MTTATNHPDQPGKHRTWSKRVIAIPLLALMAPLAIAACSSTSATTDDAPTETTIEARPDMRGVRYCEVLLISMRDGQAAAEVFNSYPLNECPEQLWSQLDAKTIASANSVPLAMLNGPRFWLMNAVQKEGATELPVTDFGGIEMYRQASVTIGSLTEQAKPYQPYEVARSALFVFDAGERIYQLTGPDGTTFVMQTWSRQIDPELTEAKLTDLGTRLQLPSGWMYSSRVLDKQLLIDTRSTSAKVLQDNLGNSYSQIT